MYLSFRYGVFEGLWALRNKAKYFKDVSHTDKPGYFTLTLPTSNKAWVAIYPTDCSKNGMQLGICESSRSVTGFLFGGGILAGSWTLQYLLGSCKNLIKHSVDAK